MPELLSYYCQRVRLEKIVCLSDIYSMNCFKFVVSQYQTKQNDFLVLAYNVGSNVVKQTCLKPIVVKNCANFTLKIRLVHLYKTQMLTKLHPHCCLTMPETIA